jgi:hypothetical protein
LTYRRTLTTDSPPTTPSGLIQPLLVVAVLAFTLKISGAYRSAKMRGDPRSRAAAFLDGQRGVDRVRRSDASHLTNYAIPWPLRPSTAA